jgi:hypothetical protein
MRVVRLLIPVWLCFSFVACSAAPAPSASEILAKASATAAAEHKRIFLRFDASW